MITIRTLLNRPEARAALGIWILIPTLFLFFALTLAVNPAAHLDRIRLGVAVLDDGVTTPEGQVSVGSQLAQGLGNNLGVEIVAFADAPAIREAVLSRDIAAGIVVPAGLTQHVLAGDPADLQIVRSDANDPFTNALTTNLVGQLGTCSTPARPASRAASQRVLLSSP